MFTRSTAVSIDLNKQQRKKSTLSITFGDTVEKKKSEQKKYTNIHWEPQEAWYLLFLAPFTVSYTLIILLRNITDGGNIMVLWKFRCPLEWTRKTRVDINNVLDKFYKGELISKLWYFLL